jgi:hypothetical protein
MFVESWTGRSTCRASSSIVLEHQRSVEAAGQALVTKHSQWQPGKHALEPAVEMRAQQGRRHAGQQPSRCAPPAGRREVIEDGDPAAGLEDPRSLPEYRAGIGRDAQDKMQDNGRNPGVRQR